MKPNKSFKGAAGRSTKEGAPGTNMGVGSGAAAVTARNTQANAMNTSTNNNSNGGTPMLVNTGGGFGNTFNNNNAAAMMNMLDETSTDDYQMLAHRLQILNQDKDRRTSSYSHRENAYRLRIRELEEEIANQKREKSGWMKPQDKMGKLKEMQGQILSRIELVQDRTAKILQEQERDLLRAFRARLFDVQTELEKEKSKKDDGAVAWIGKSPLTPSQNKRVNGLFRDYRTLEKA
jgi:hypothetical protein